MITQTRSPAVSSAVRPIRQDAWWVGPLITVVVVVVFAVYAVWAAAQGTNYRVEPYLSPFYSPVLGEGWWTLSPAFLVIWIPLGFRLTCYYFRKTYYRSFFGDPPACALPERRGASYTGESRFPFILQNLHRYFLYLAILLVVVHWYETIQAFVFDGRFGIGLGTLFLLAEAVLLSGYVFSCHSFRHLVGGCLDCYSHSALGRARHRVWSRVSLMNERHHLYFWASLIAVWAADLYVRLLASGAIGDPRIIF
ncbi:MAG: succinate dehydrogenase [Chloroflexi bacterium]|nr:succinate dehydrogenase [Chloroflexota bacterium]